MIEISRNERNYLEKSGCKFGVDIHKTYSKHPKYYLVENPKNIKKLNKYKKLSVIKTVA